MLSYLAEGFELLDDAVLELLQESGILAPEQPDVWNVEELHCESLKA